MPPTTIERAFELARSGQCRTLPELKQRLRAERLEAVDSHLAGRSIKAQLNALMSRAT